MWVTPTRGHLDGCSWAFWVGNIHLSIHLFYIFHPSVHVAAWWWAKQSCPSPLADKEPLLDPSSLIGWRFIPLCGLSRSEDFNSCNNFLLIQKCRHVSGGNESLKKKNLLIIFFFNALWSSFCFNNVILTFNEDLNVLKSIKVNVFSWEHKDAHLLLLNQGTCYSRVHECHMQEGGSMGAKVEKDHFMSVRYAPSRLAKSKLEISWFHAPLTRLFWGPRWQFVSRDSLTREVGGLELSDSWQQSPFYCLVPWATQTCPQFFV